jgi:hypothetical protein
VPSERRADFSEVETRLDQLRMSNLDLNFSVNDRDGICPHAISQGMPVGSPVVPSPA